MKAIVQHEFGGRDVLQLQEIDTPEAGPGEVLVKVEAAAVNHLDVWVRKGVGNPRLAMPHVLGADVAGVVEGVGAGVDSVEAGERVVLNPGVSCGVCRQCLAGHDNLCKRYRILGEHRWGGYAEYVVVPQQNILPRPEGITVEEAAAFPLTFLTAWQMIVRKLEVQPGDNVLVMAAGSGVSTAAIQIARLRGGRVIVTSSSRKKIDYAMTLGADDGVIYTEPGWSKEVKALTNGQGADKVVDHTGADFWAEVIKSTAWGGRIAVAGASSGYEATTPMPHIFYRQLSILGSTMGSKSDLHDIIPFIESGELMPKVDRILPLADASEGHRVLEDREVMGKVVLRVGA